MFRTLERQVNLFVLAVQVDSHCALTLSFSFDFSFVRFRCVFFFLFKIIRFQYDFEVAFWVLVSTKRRQVVHTNRLERAHYYYIYGKKLETRRLSRVATEEINQPHEGNTSAFRKTIHRHCQRLLSSVCNWLLIGSD